MSEPLSRRELRRLREERENAASPVSPSAESPRATPPPPPVPGPVFSRPKWKWKQYALALEQGIRDLTAQLEHQRRLIIDLDGYSHMEAAVLLEQRRREAEQVRVEAAQVLFSAQREAAMLLERAQADARAVVADGAHRRAQAEVDARHIVATAQAEAALLLERVRQDASITMANAQERHARVEAELRHLTKSAREEAASILSDARSQAEASVSDLLMEAALSQRQLAETTAKLADLQQEIVQLDDILLLQQAGIYDYSRPGHDSEWYRNQLAEVRERQKHLVRSRDAVTSMDGWSVNGSTVEGRKMVKQTADLMLRAYNSQADDCVMSMKPFRLQAQLDRLEKTVNVIGRLGTTLQIRISPAYHDLKCIELELTADYLAAVEEEKEQAKAERERLKEEREIERELQRERDRVAREASLKRQALEAAEARQHQLLRDAADAADLEAAEQVVADLREKVDEFDAAEADIYERLANRRVGHVYVISNLGTMGERMVKIGMTRRLVPQERVDELGDASVPFRFDVHLLLFSEDAVGLETRLHQYFADRRVNLVNLRREFFYTTPEEVRQVLRTFDDNYVIHYQSEQLAPEWRSSESQRALLPSQRSSSDGLIMEEVR